MSTETGTQPQPAKQEDFWGRLDDRMDHLSDYLNPILVKETRQALKSRPFLVTFFLLLTCAWGWSLLAVALQTKNNSFQLGRTTLWGYFVVLLIPMVIIVPYTAFRSLAKEREDGTHELLSITTLAARQVVMGKLGSAVMQMIFFYSVLAPCITFTYLLRGVDIVVIGMLLWYTLVISIVLSALGLLLAAAARASQWQMLLSLLLLAGLVIAAICWLNGGLFMIEEASTTQTWFWYVNLAINMGAASFLVLFLQGAAAQLSFASDNRSTKIRITMLTQSAIFVGWMALRQIQHPDWGFAMVVSIIAGIYWAVMGSLLVGEIGVLSQRVRRTLPQTGLGRVLFTLFNPGGGTGYFFTLCNLAAVVVVANITLMLMADRHADEHCIMIGLLVFMYVTSYLGVTRLIIAYTARWAQPGPLGSFVITVVLAILGCLVPMIFQLLFWRVFSDDYTVLQAPNWMWTLVEAVDQRGRSDVFSTMLIMVAISFIILAVNLIVGAREVNQHRESLPERVHEEDLAKSPKPTVKAQSHPLDEV